jgi:hypothetical protein
MESTRLVVYSGRLDKGPHSGRWIRLAVTDDGVGKTSIGDTEEDTRRQMEPPICRVRPHSAPDASLPLAVLTGGQSSPGEGSSP